VYSAPSLAAREFSSLCCLESFLATEIVTPFKGRAATYTGSRTLEQTLGSIRDKPQENQQQQAAIAERISDDHLDSIHFPPHV
jgi:hypothetical protein